jgi:stress response protein SCP2
LSDNILLNIDTEKAYKINIGIDWGNTKKIGFIGKVFGFLRNKVDIDLSAYFYDINGAFLDSINANKLITCHGFIKHSGDDKSGDNKEDDTNNESITIINKNISSRVKAIIFIIDIRGSNLEIIPYLNLNIVLKQLQLIVFPQKFQCKNIAYWLVPNFLKLLNRLFGEKHYQ